MNHSFLKRLIAFIPIVFLCSCGRNPSTPIAFDPARTAEAETRMWQAYYDANPMKLYQELTTLIEVQFDLSPQDAQGIAQGFGAAAMYFNINSSGYENHVIPKLTESYQMMLSPSGLSYDPEAAARAELAWWVARRTPGEDSAEQVGSLIGHLYSVLYGAERSEFVVAGELRARAAALRDSTPPSCDWHEIQNLLTESYFALTISSQ